MYAIIKHNSNFPDRDATIQLNTSAHNIGFSSVKLCNCLFFKLFRFPRKELLQHIQEREYGEKVQAEKKELIALVRPYLSRLYESNKKEDADLIRSYFEEYVNPTSLSSIASRITRDQEKRAAAMLAAYFGF